MAVHRMSIRVNIYEWETRPQVGSGSGADLQRRAHLRPLLGVKQTKLARKQTWRLERLLSEVKQTCRSVGSDFRC